MPVVLSPFWPGLRLPWLQSQKKTFAKQMSNKKGIGAWGGGGLIHLRANSFLALDR